jgi:hypothetical protein
VVARDGGHAVEVLAVVLGRVSAHGLVLGVRIAVLVLAAHDGGLRRAVRAGGGRGGGGPRRLRIFSVCVVLARRAITRLPCYSSARRQSPASGQRVSDRGRSPPSPPALQWTGWRAPGYHRARLPFLHAAVPLVHHDGYGWLRTGTSRDSSSSASSAAAI